MEERIDVTVPREEARFNFVLQRIWIATLTIALSLLVPGNWREVTEFGLNVLRASLVDMGPGPLFLTALLVCWLF